MKLKNISVAVITSLSASGVFASGFGLYEPSTVYHAMGGAVVGKAMDASANFANPATLTDLTNIWVTVGFVTEHPRAMVRGNTGGSPWGEDQVCDPGLFWLPHFQLAVPLPGDFTFGLSASAEYGLGTEYDHGWTMDWNSRETTVQGYVLNPNLAYKITDKWSVAVGLRWLYFDFETMSDPQVASSGYELARVHNRLKGDNGWKSFGWVVGTKYDILDNLSVGVVYKSQIDATIEGTTSTTLRQLNASGIDTVGSAAAVSALAEKGIGPSHPYFSTLYPAAKAAAIEKVQAQVREGVNAANGSAECDMKLPQSVTAGINWDVTPEHHLGFAVSWTQWSVFDTLHFKLAGGDRDVKLNWNDTWRGSVGYAWDFHPDWTWMVSYTFDQDCVLDKDQDSAMLPPAHRNIATTGFKWNIWRNMDLVLDYSCIFMDGGSFDTTDKLGQRYHFETCRGFCHAVGFSVTYRF